MTLTIWRFTDSKAGHETQSIGLCDAINKIKPCQCFDIPATTAINNLNNFILNKFPLGKGLPDPDLIIGAGHGTHLSMLTARRVRGGKVVVLMKPTLPTFCFDLCIIPQHDLPPDKDNIISTQGALSPIKFNEKKEPNTGLILIGGPSEHYDWNSLSIVNQIKTIIAHGDEVRWRIANSPRSPDEITGLLEQQMPMDIEFFPYTETTTDALHQLIFSTETIWVSRDSISMIFESLSSGARVGFLEVKEKKVTRVSRAVNKLYNEDQITSFSKWMINHQYTKGGARTNEAENCAKLMQEKGLLK